jgi:PPM family protein phosphatase
MRFRVGAGTNAGRVRELNEDVYLSRAERGLFLVCDGMGGCPAGEVASQVAADVILEYLNGFEPDETACVGHDDEYLAPTTRLAEAVQQSNQRIYTRAQANPREAGMGTTVVGAWISEHIASVAHVGDSRAYLWRDNRLERLTRDHSVAEASVRTASLARGHGRSGEYDHVLLRVVGREPQVDVELREVPVLPGDVLLLCSDGLTSMVPEPALAQAFFRFSDPQQISEHLIDAANRNGGADNITVVVVEVIGGWWQRVRSHRRPPLSGGRDAQVRPAL